MGREMEGRFGREGTWVYLWLILDVWQKTTKFCKANILQFKKIIKWSEKKNYWEFRNKPSLLVTCFSTRMSKQSSRGKNSLSTNFTRISEFVVQLLSRAWLFPTPWTATLQASLFFTISACSNSCPLSQ